MARRELRSTTRGPAAAQMLKMLDDLVGEQLAAVHVSSQLIRVAYGGASLLAVVLGGVLFNRPALAE
jgi:hypothetical protein